MTFDALYITDADDDGHRVINAASLAEAKAILQAEMAAEGKTYHLDALIETKASFVAAPKPRRPSHKPGASGRLFCCPAPRLRRAALRRGNEFCGAA